MHLALLGGVSGVQVLLVVISKESREELLKSEAVEEHITGSQWHLLQVQGPEGVGGTAEKG